MIHRTIIERATRIVKCKFDDVQRDKKPATISENELTHIATALSVAALLCLANDQKNGR